MTRDVEVYEVPPDLWVAYHKRIDAVPEERRKYLPRPGFWHAIRSFFRSIKP